jgi:hypothetical protein
VKIKELLAEIETIRRTGVAVDMLDVVLSVDDEDFAEIDGLYQTRGAVRLSPAMALVSQSAYEDVEMERDELRQELRSLVDTEE